MEQNNFQVIVVGAGHAGIEAALACARNKIHTLLLCMNLDSIGFLACNPSIGGTAKGHLVREIDALGGQMGIAADKNLIQLRMLNRSKGAAVQSLRAQVDKFSYHRYMKNVLENQPYLRLRQGEAAQILTKNCGNFTSTCGVATTYGQQFFAPIVILACGVYLNSRIYVGESCEEIGPNGLKSCKTLTQSLQELGFEVRRFKTGTPARVHADSIDFDKLEVQEGEGDIYSFSFLSKKTRFDKSVCYLGYTNAHTHDTILQNLHKSPVFSGKIHATGARYCPSIEDKIVRFADKERHPFFLEPEGLDCKEMYVQGISTAFSPQMQEQIYQSLGGMEGVKIMRDAYAIEYDCINPHALHHTLEAKNVSGLFFCGQINGTSGYEEAAAQGLVAGINAAAKFLQRKPLVLTRGEAYIGVMIDDLVLKGSDEPYRMMTSRAEHRLHLRQDNADLRLTHYAIEHGLATRARINAYNKKKKQVKELQEMLDVTFAPKQTAQLWQESGQKSAQNGYTLRELFKRNELSVFALKKLPELERFDIDAVEVVLTDQRYDGYLQRQMRAINELNKLEERQLPQNLDYLQISGMRIEARQKLDKQRPKTLGQASRINGVNPADINVLIIYLSKLENK